MLNLIVILHLEINHTLNTVFTSFYGNYRTADTYRCIYSAMEKMGYKFAV